ncbi:MAG: hypothetical protein K2Y29_14195 [Beijerinckiaceae bacterium]|nr:hypothetical protein [Beijerinckiaceae bacterium]
MSKRSLEDRIYTPDDLSILSKAFRRACAECDLTGPAGQTLLARALMSSFKHGVTKEDDLVDVARIMVWRRRGLDGGLHVVQPAGSRRQIKRR